MMPYCLFLILINLRHMLRLTSTLLSNIVAFVVLKPSEWNQYGYKIFELKYCCYQVYCIYMIWLNIFELIHKLSYKITDTHRIHFCDYVWPLGVLQVLTKSEYVAHRTAAESLAKLIKPDERPQKTILDIGAGTGLVAEEVFIV